MLKYRRCILLFCFFILQNAWANLCPLWASVVSSLLKFPLLSFLIPSFTCLILCSRFAPCPCCRCYLACLPTRSPCSQKLRLLKEIHHHHNICCLLLTPQSSTFLGLPLARVAAAILLTCLHVHLAHKSLYIYIQPLPVTLWPGTQDPSRTCCHSRRATCRITKSLGLTWDLTSFSYGERPAHLG
jgi:hypothetical protein